MPGRRRKEKRSFYGYEKCIISEGGRGVMVIRRAKSADAYDLRILYFESQEGTFPDACIATNFSLNENGDIM